MSLPKKRNPLLLNKFQQLVLYPVLAACVLACGISLYCVFYMQYMDDHLGYFSGGGAASLQQLTPWAVEFNRINRFVPAVLSLLVVALVVVIIWAWYISYKLLGPYERILRELDEMVSDKIDHQLDTRKGDLMFDELVKRINALLGKKG